MSSNGGGKLIVISGPSGVGKSTVCDRLSKLPRCRRIVTCTTRLPRPLERQGEHYCFLRREEFEAGLRRDEFLEHAEVHGHLYGTPRSPVEEAIRRGDVALLAIDVQGAAALRRQAGGPRPEGAPGAGLLAGKLVTVFLMPPDDKTLEARLRGRGTEGEKAAAARLETARQEMNERDKYDHIVVNDDLDEAVGKIAALIAKTIDKP
jgi:guanylate kinase